MRLEVICLISMAIIINLPGLWPKKKDFGGLFAEITTVCTHPTLTLICICDMLLTN
jgi:hypothetical protein